MSDWKRGLPPGKYYEGMIHDYEVFFAVTGGKWHRRRTPEEKTSYLAALEKNRTACAPAITLQEGGKP